MTPEQFIARLGNPEHQFAETLAFIDATFEHQPTAFDNGPVHNSAEQNQGSCKVLAMSLDLGLSDEQALQCFGEHYRSVLATPDGSDHGNIRALMQGGLAKVSFAGTPLTRRQG